MAHRRASQDEQGSGQDESSHAPSLRRREDVEKMYSFFAGREMFTEKTQDQDTITRIRGETREGDNSEKRSPRQRLGKLQKRNSCYTWERFLTQPYGKVFFLLSCANFRARSVRHCQRLRQSLHRRGVRHARIPLPREFSQALAGGFPLQIALCAAARENRDHPQRPRKTSKRGSMAQAASACSFKPSARMTFNTVANSGFPSADSALYRLSRPS